MGTSSAFEIQLTVPPGSVEFLIGNIKPQDPGHQRAWYSIGWVENIRVPKVRFNQYHVMFSITSRGNVMSSSVLYLPKIMFAHGIGHD